MYTHLGRPSKLLSSLVRISINSLIVVLFKVVNNVSSLALRLYRKNKKPANLTAGRISIKYKKNIEPSTLGHHWCRRWTRTTTNPNQVRRLSKRQYDTPYMYSLIQAAGSHTSLRQHPQSPSALLDLQSGFCIIRSVCCDCFATIRPSILTTSLGLWFLWFTLLPPSLIALIGT